MDPTDPVPQHCTKSCAILILVNFRQADNKKSPLKNLMRLFLDESQGDALEVRPALMGVRQAQQLYAVLLIQLGDQPRLTHLLQTLNEKNNVEK